MLFKSYNNGILNACIFLLADVPRMEKSPLLANGYNHPPTHLSHMQFMQLGGHPGAGHTAILSPASLPHHLQAQAQARAEQGLKVNPNMTNMEALARWVFPSFFLGLSRRVKSDKKPQAITLSQATIFQKLRFFAAGNIFINFLPKVYEPGTSHVGRNGNRRNARRGTVSQWKVEEKLSFDISQKNYSFEFRSSIPVLHLLSR